MTDSPLDSAQAAEAWENYWLGVAEAGAYDAGGVSHPAIQAFWKELFFEAAQHYSNPSVFDIASGSGPLLDVALLAFGVEGADITSVDISESAIEGIRERFPGVQGLVADATSIPLDTGVFDLIVSQFGVEYAGTDAIYEAARLLAPGGQMALMLHKQGGCIHHECAATLDAIERVQESKFIPHALETLRAGFAAVRGADREPYESAAKMLAPAIGALEEILAQYGDHVAGDTVISLYCGVADIHSDIQQYDPDEVLGWLERLGGELGAFKDRMSSMIDSAIDHDTFEQICTSLRNLGCTIEQAGPHLAPGNDLPLAWTIVASRPGAGTGAGEQA
jgi:SAM-dependent methyltransferase